MIAPAAHFDVCGPLPSGVTLLEASAGTGKTFTIAALAARFVAEGTPLEHLAKERNFRATFSAPEEVGGRYSALTVFGLVPAALIGVDVGAVLARARRTSRMVIHGTGQLGATAQRACSL